MAVIERPHPDDPGYRNHWKFKLRRGLVPRVTYRRSPYLASFLWRHRYVARFTRGKDVLDVPCGMGWGTSMYRGCRTLTGVDVEPEAIREARERYGYLAEFRIGSMADLEFPDESFDVVACLEGIEHVTPDVARAFIRESHRILRPQGVLVVSSPHCQDGDHSGNPYHEHEYRPEELQELLAPCFDTVEEQSRTVRRLVVTLVCLRKRPRDPAGKEQQRA